MRKTDLEVGMKRPGPLVARGEVNWHEGPHRQKQKSGVLGVTIEFVDLVKPLPEQSQHVLVSN